jgi:predicted transcriptional regulator
MNADGVPRLKGSAISSSLVNARRQLRAWGGRYVGETYTLIILAALVGVGGGLGDMARLLQQKGLSDYPVIDDDQVLRGIVTFQDIRSVIMRADPHSMLIAVDLMQEDPPVIEARASLLEALRRRTTS